METLVIVYNIAVLLIVALSVLLFFTARHSSKILGKGMITDLLNVIVAVQVMLIFKMAMDILSLDNEWINYIKIFFDFAIPVILLYALWSIKKHADALKSMVG